MDWRELKELYEKLLGNPDAERLASEAGHGDMATLEGRWRKGASESFRQDLSDLPRAAYSALDEAAFGALPNAPMGDLRERRPGMAMAAGIGSMFLPGPKGLKYLNPRRLLGKPKQTLYHGTAAKFPDEELRARSYGVSDDTRSLWGAKSFDHAELYAGHGYPGPVGDPRVIAFDADMTRPDRYRTRYGNAYQVDEGAFSNPRTVQGEVSTAPFAELRAPFGEITRGKHAVKPPPQSPVAPRPGQPSTPKGPFNLPGPKQPKSSTVARENIRSAARKPGSPGPSAPPGSGTPGATMKTVRNAPEWIDANVQRGRVQELFKGSEEWPDLRGIEVGTDINKARSEIWDKMRGFALDPNSEIGHQVVVNPQGRISRHNAWTQANRSLIHSPWPNRPGLGSTNYDIHNHPSSIPNPSGGDLKHFKQFDQAGRVTPSGSEEFTPQGLQLVLPKGESWTYPEGRSTGMTIADEGFGFRRGGKGAANLPRRGDRIPGRDRTVMKSMDPSLSQERLDRGLLPHRTRWGTKRVEGAEQTMDQYLGAGEPGTMFMDSGNRPLGLGGHVEGDIDELMMSMGSDRAYFRGKPGDLAESNQPNLNFLGGPDRNLYQYRTPDDILWPGMSRRMDEAPTIGHPDYRKAMAESRITPGLPGMADARRFRPPPGRFGYLGRK